MAATLATKCGDVATLSTNVLLEPVKPGRVKIIIAQNG
jgi:hypothetical protein